MARPLTKKKTNTEVPQSAPAKRGRPFLNKHKAEVKRASSVSVPSTHNTQPDHSSSQNNQSPLPPQTPPVPILPCCWFLEPLGPEGQIVPYRLESRTCGIFFMADGSCMQWVPTRLCLNAPSLGLAHAGTAAEGATAVLYVNPGGHCVLSALSDRSVELPPLLHSKLRWLLHCWPPAGQWLDDPLSAVGRPEPALLHPLRWRAADAREVSLYAAHEPLPVARPLAADEIRRLAVYCVSSPGGSSQQFLIPYVLGVTNGENGPMAEMANVVEAYDQHLFQTHPHEVEVVEPVQSRINWN